MHFLRTVKNQKEKWSKWQQDQQDKKSNESEITKETEETEVEEEKKCSFLPMFLSSCIMSRIVRVSSHSIYHSDNGFKIRFLQPKNCPESQWQDSK